MNVRLILLAAGNSRRFGTNKLFYEVDGKPMYRHMLDRLVNICGRHPGWEIVVVSQYEKVIEDVKGPPAVPVYCEESKNGVSYSIKAGILAGDLPAVCAFFVADQPFLTEETAESFLQMMEDESASLGCVTCNGETGNPVWFSKEYFPELLALSGDTGGKRVLKAHMEKALFFTVKNPKELEDFDRKP